MNHLPSGSTGSPLVPPFPLIRERLRQGRIIPFLGSGASRDRSKRKRLPNSAILARYFARKTRFPENESRDLAKVAQYYNVVAGREPLHEELHKVFTRDYQNTSLHTFLAEVPVPLLIVTTNYDNLIERAFQDKARKFDVVIQTAGLTLSEQLLWWQYGNTEPIEVLSKDLDIDLDSVTVIYKMHGALDREQPDRDQYVITEDDYIDFLVRMIKNTAIPDIFAERFLTRPFLFLGYSLRDWNLRVVLNYIEKTLRRPKGIKSWAIQDNPSPLEKRFWQERGVEVFNMKIDDFVERLKQP
ncbi:MAG: SIR2 family protein [candidate division KSB1 bacterium]|nr:SIR2 family protein [candidate division KSB1 bacterium]MDZ7301755.1 SIR2 family protein [candidate division KSB1 bacterium]MDZ7311466.1 SIR2 family protein [candidate division KSB1 bacterium]